jgi:hypothetical protein
MFDPLHNLRLQVKGWLLENDQTQAQLSKLLGFKSESTISEFLSGGTLTLATYTRLQAIVSSPPQVNLNPRICHMQASGKHLKGILELNREKINEAIELSIQKDNEKIFEANNSRKEGVVWNASHNSLELHFTKPRK